MYNIMSALTEDFGLGKMIACELGRVLNVLVAASSDASWRLYRFSDASQPKNRLSWILLYCSMLHSLGIHIHVHVLTFVLALRTTSPSESHLSLCLFPALELNPICIHCSIQTFLPYFYCSPRFSLAPSKTATSLQKGVK